MEAGQLGKRELASLINSVAALQLQPSKEWLRAWQRGIATALSAQYGRTGVSGAISAPEAVDMLYSLAQLKQRQGRLQAQRQLSSSGGCGSGN